MRYVERELEGQLRLAARSFPVVVLTGPRRAGKTFMLQHLLPKAEYRLLEDPELVGRLRQDPQGFLDALRPPVVLDEVQNVPEVFAWVRARADRRPRRAGQWFLTGSQEAPRMSGISESLAGRAAVLQLLPFSSRESARVGLLRGGYPEVVARPKAAGLWFSSFLQTYLERDVRAVTAVRDLATFRRFLALVASRHGQVLNKSDLAAPLGVSVPTIGEWLGVLETTAQILLVPSFFENLGKRLVKSPKLYVADSGLACHLLGIETAAELERSSYLGALFEGFVASEIVKRQVHSGRRKQLYYFRDQQGLEVDFVVPRKGGGFDLVEAKSTRSPAAGMAVPLRRLANALRRRHRGVSLRQWLVHRPAKGAFATPALGPGARAIPWQELNL
jgi:uncharacterized protein